MPAGHVVSEERRRPGIGWQGPRTHWVRDRGGMTRRRMQQTDSQDGAARVAPTIAASEAQTGLDRRKLNAVRDELRRAELSFVAARRSLQDPIAREAAGRIADALGRTGCALDREAIGAAVHPAAEVLEGVSRFDPADHPGEFRRLAARSVALAGRILAASGFAAIAYWGRTLCRLAEAFAGGPLDSAA